MATTLVLLWLMTGSAVLPIKALLMSFLTLGVTTGVLVLVFQDGRFESLLGYTSQGGIEEADFLVLAAIAFAISTDYGVFVLGRIKEAHDRGLSQSRAITTGIGATGRLVSAAAVLLAVAMGAFATSQIVFLKEIGVGAVVAVLVDAFVVRALLVPSLMALLGEPQLVEPARAASPARAGRAERGRARGRVATPDPTATLSAPWQVSHSSTSATDRGTSAGSSGSTVPSTTSSRLAYFALYALQHRGQESAGIAAADHGGYIITQRALGLVSQVFKEHDLRALGGDLAIGHVRYSTTGSNEWENSQPVHRSDGAGGNRRELALAHNGNLINAVELHAELREREVTFSSTSDSEIIAALLATHQSDDIEDAIADVMPRLQGAFSTVVMTKKRVYAFRDPAGVRPLVLGHDRRPLLRRVRDVRLRHHRRASGCATSRPASSSRSARTGSAPARSSRARARRSASSSTSTSRGPTRAWAATSCRPPAGGWARSSRARRRRRPPTSSSRCPTRATPPRAASRAPPACPRTTASSRTATWRGPSSSPARSCASTACG